MNILTLLFKFGWFLSLVTSIFDLSGLTKEDLEKFNFNAMWQKVKDTFKGKIKLTPEIIVKRLEFEVLMQKAGGFEKLLDFLKKGGKIAELEGKPTASPTVETLLYNIGETVELEAEKKSPNSNPSQHNLLR